MFKCKKKTENQQTPWNQMNKKQNELEQNE